MRIDRHVTSGGRCIYSFQVQAFPQLRANIYVINDGEKWILIDTGSGMDQSNKELLAGFEAIGSEYGERVQLEDLDAILISHAHIDHFGGLPFVRNKCQAPVGVHQLDRRVLTHYEERVLVASRHLDTFLQEAGVKER